MRKLAHLFIPADIQGKARVEGVYQRVVVLALVIHLLFILFFHLLPSEMLRLYNLASVLFYVAMVWVVRQGWYRFVVSAIHLEVSLFVTVTTLTCGWDVGVSLYLIALAGLVYFCPFHHTFVPYLIALAEMGLFIGLRLHTQFGPPPFIPPHPLFLTFYLLNTLVTFGVILGIAFLSNLTAALGRQALQVENAALTALAGHDSLTALLNRRALLERLASYSGQPLVYGMADVDDFKVINDTYGHACGDHVLETLADMMRSRFPSADLCRWGGEEFVLVFRSDDPARISHSVRMFCRELADRPIRYEDRLLHVTMTFGLCAGDGAQDPEAMLELADRRLYYGKRHGKNQVVDHLSEAVLR